MLCHQKPYRLLARPYRLLWPDVKIELFLLAWLEFRYSFGIRALEAAFFHAELVAEI